MPYVSNQGVRIHYEVEGSGTPLVLHHGTMGSYESWKDFGYVDALKGDHQMRSRALANDLEALLALTQDRSTMEEIPPTMTMPRLLFVGEADPRSVSYTHLDVYKRQVPSTPAVTTRSWP